jgi:hypothetical protein
MIRYVLVVRGGVLVLVLVGVVLVLVCFSVVCVRVCVRVCVGGCVVDNHNTSSKHLTHCPPPPPAPTMQAAELATKRVHGMEVRIEKLTKQVLLPLILPLSSFHPIITSQ